MTTLPLPANAASALATTVIDELVRHGLRDLVLCPGSRSAALAYAAHALAESGRLRLHTRIDERTAAFLALGLARSSGRPVAVVTTSGTAVANLHPAVLEAAHAGLPLVLLTADRPASLRGTQANQTTEQPGIFAGAVRLAADVPAPYAGGDEEGRAAGWRALVSRAVAAATGRTGPAGPAHLNLQFSEPLVPGAHDGWEADVEGRRWGSPWTTFEAQPETSVRLSTGLRTVVVAGDDAGPSARGLAERAGWPLFAEPTSGARTGTHAIRTHRLLLDVPGLADRIERVVVCGHPTLSRPVNQLLSRSDVEVIAVGNRTGWTDPGHRVSKLLGAVTVNPAAEDGAEVVDDKGWLADWQQADAALSRRLDEWAAADERIGPHTVAQEVSAALPPGGMLFVGASNPVRDLDLMATPYPVGERRLVIGNRGLAGIDGSVSSAIGAALGRRGAGRALAYLGDLTFLHDFTALVLGPEEVRPDLTIVVVNDDGGSIFASLEQGASEYAGSFERLFGTPHGLDLAAVCAATRTPHWRVHSLAELRHALRAPFEGIEVLEVVVDRRSRRDLDAQIRQLVASS